MIDPEGAAYLIRVWSEWSLPTDRLRAASSGDRFDTIDSGCRTVPLPLVHAIEMAGEGKRYAEARDTALIS